MDWHKTIRIEYDGKGENIKETELRFKWHSVVSVAWPNPINPEQWTTIISSGGMMVIKEKIEDVCRQIDENRELEEKEYMERHIRMNMPQLTMQSKVLQKLEDMGQ